MSNHLPEIQTSPSGCDQCGILTLKYYLRKGVHPNGPEAKEAVLRKTQLFARLAESEMRTFCARVSEMHFARGEALFSEGTGAMTTTGESATERKPRWNKSGARAVLSESAASSFSARLCWDPRSPAPCAP